MTDKAQDNTYINIRAKTPIKSNLIIYKCWFTENSETVLKDAIYVKPKHMKQTTQSYLEGVNIKVNSKLIKKNQNKNDVQIQYGGNQHDVNSNMSGNSTWLTFYETKEILTISYSGTYQPLSCNFINSN